MSVAEDMAQRLYTPGSLSAGADGVRFELSNRLDDMQLTAVLGVRLDGRDLAPADVELRMGAERRAAPGVTAGRPVRFGLGETLEVATPAAALGEGAHELEVRLESLPFGELHLTVRDEVGPGDDPAARIPRSEDDDYGGDAVRQRQEWVRGRTGAKLDTVTRFAFDPHLARGNCENLVGAAQVPLGIAGPLRINGEHARGEFLVPLATAEGTLVASYNRGMRALNQSGGVTCTVTDDAMQRAPVFAFDSARAGRDFVAWVRASHDTIRQVAEATNPFLELAYIDPYTASKFVFLRFGFHTHDAAGQNMVGRATHAASLWILRHYEGIRNFYLEGNLATDKKPSHINTLRTRGRRVTAEATIPAAVLRRDLRADPRALAYHAGVANLGAMMAGVNNNGLHSANGITALFIATGQDVANVAESCAALLYTELTAAGDLYLSITLPSLIVATHGGGTGLATQRECLELLGCTGPGTVNKLAEIVAGVVLAGELSLAAAISSYDWVTGHERYGRHA
ncbi:MAG TPA: hydroxymethylglutaryl-CoA reductase [Longimicrobium sp.]|nr:hydroxymethylglutaryl-CoA reductase [Longimicrobium sp.]